MQTVSKPLPSGGETGSELPPDYDAFASYATDPDRDLVRDVEDFIESLHDDPLMPAEFRSPLELCVDGRDFHIPKSKRDSEQADDLMRSVVRAYQAASRCLIVFSGPRSLTHPWINKEITWWCERFGTDRVYFALTHGHLPKDAQGRPILTEVMPQELARRGGGANRIWFDLRGFYAQRAWTALLRSGYQRELRREASQWLSVRDYAEERFRLAAQILSEKVSNPLVPNKLIPSWRAAIRIKRHRVRYQIAGATAFVILAALVAWMLQYRNSETQQVIALTSKAQAAIDDQQYERAMRIALQGIPVPGQLPWSLTWSDPVVKRLAGKLAGAAQLSAMIAQLQEGSERDRGNFVYAAFSPDGTKVVTAAENGRATVWDVVGKTRIAECKRDAIVPSKYLRQFENLDWIWTSQFSPEGNRTVSASHDGVAWIWTPEDQRCVGVALLPPHGGPVRGAAFSRNPPGKFVVTASADGTTQLWDALTAKPVQPPRPWKHGALTSVDFSPNGTTVVVSSAEGFVGIVDVMKKGDPLELQAGGAAVWSAKFNSDGTRVVTSSDDGRVFIYDAETGQRLSWLPKQTHNVNSAAFSDDGFRLVTASADKTVRVWDIKDLYNIALLFVFKGHSEQQSVRHAEFSPDGNRIVSASSDQTLRIWDAMTNANPPMVRGHNNSAVREVEISPDGKNFATVAEDGVATLWATGRANEIGQPKFSWNDHGGAKRTAFGPLSDQITILFNNGFALIRDTTTNSVLWTSSSSSTPDTGQGSVTGFTSLSSHRVLVVAIDEAGKDAQIWDVHTNDHWPLRTQRRARLKMAELNTNNTRVISVLEAGKAQMWDAETGEELFTIDESGVTSAHFSPDGSSVVTASLNRTVRVWDARTGQQTRQLLGHGGDVNGARFSSDGSRIVSASGDHTVRVWDPETENQIIRYVVGGDAFDAAFTADGNQIIVGLYDGNLEMFDAGWTKERDQILLAKRVCKEKLMNAERFTADDGVDQSLSPFVGTNPCDRAGLLAPIFKFFNGSEQAVRRILSNSTGGN